MKKIFSLKNILIAISLVIVDIAVYLFLGLLLMNYDDFYDESKGEYWSLESMNTTEKATYIGFNIWGALNILFVCYLLYRAYNLIGKAN